MDNMLPELLKATRLGLGKRIEDISASSGLAFSVVSRLENGLTQPIVISLVKLAQALSLTSHEVGHALGIDISYNNAIESNHEISRAANPDMTIDAEYLKTAFLEGGVLTFCDVGRYIREMRTKQDLSIRDLCAKTGISINTISRLERGMVDRLFLSEIIKIDKALETDGLIFDLFWAAGEFQAGIIRNKAQM